MASSIRSRPRAATLALAALLLATGSAAHAQIAAPATAPSGDSSDVPAAAPAGERRRVAGDVVKPGTKGMLPVQGALVTLHRVGSDAAGPLDSLRTGSDGRYAFRYVTSGEGNAVYFVSVSYGGIAYLSQPLRQAVVTGDDAVITVFDTTSAQLPLSLKGRHLVVERAEPGGLRRVTEVFDLSNDTTVTAIAPSDREGRPTFAEPLPSGARDFQLRDGDISADAVVFAGGEARVYAPFSPGLKQLAYSYRLPASAFPLSVPLGRKADVLEVLVEDAAATVSGARLVPVSPAGLSGKTFRRFLAQDVPATGVVAIGMGAPPDAPRNVPLIVAVVVALAGVLAFLANLLARRAPRTAAAAPGAINPDALARRIADLDARHAARADASAAERDAYERERATLKGELAALLARSRPSA